MALTIGDQAPDVALEDQDGVLRRRDELQDKVLVLFFYPKDDTPGCTAEACAFRSDDAVSHRKFAQRYQLPFPLLSDQGQRLRSSFGVPKVLGLLPGRVTYVIDAEGTIRHIFNNMLDGPAHVREAERIVKELSKG